MFAIDCAPPFVVAAGNVDRLHALCALDITSAKQDLLKGMSALRKCISVLGSLKEVTPSTADFTTVLAFRAERDALAVAIATLLDWESASEGAAATKTAGASAGCCGWFVGLLRQLCLVAPSASLM